MGSFDNNNGTSNGAFENWGPNGPISNRPVAPTTPSAPASNKRSRRTKGAIQRSQPINRMTDMEKFLRDSKGRVWGQAPCGDGDPVAPLNTVLVNLVHVSPLYEMAEGCHIFELGFPVIDHVTGTNVLDDKGKPLVTHRVFGVCPKCKGTGLYLLPNGKPDLSDGVEKRCFGCYASWAAPDWMGEELDGRFLVEYPNMELWMSQVFGPVIGKSRRAVDLLVNDNLRVIAHRELVKIVYPLYEKLARILGCTLDGPEKAAAAGLTIQAYWEAKAQKNLLARTLWRYTDESGTKLGIKDIWDWLNTDPRLAGLTDQVCGAIDLTKRSRAVGVATKSGVLVCERQEIFGTPSRPTEPAPEAISKDQELFRFATAAVTGLKAFFANETPLTSRGLTAAAAKVLEESLEGDITPKALFEALHAKGIGPKSREAVLKGAGVKLHELSALEQCL